jgi:thiol-disulfide isomerase/thioredoxin
MDKKKKYIGIGFISGLVFTLAAEIAIVLWFGMVHRPNELKSAMEAPPMQISTEPGSLYNLSLLPTDNSKVINLEDEKDNIIFLNFWTTWCQPCIVEMPSIEALKNKFEGKNVKFYLVSDEPIEKIRKFEQKRGFDLPFYKSEGLIPPSYDGSSVPRTYIIANGKIIYEHTGMAKWDDTTVVNFINAQL